jgi:hypothetical protein
LNRRTAIIAGVIAAAGAGGAYLWLDRPNQDERAIRSRLEALRQEINTSTIDGLGTVAHAAQIGNYYTDDVKIELGEGTAEIQGRETVMGMAARLQPRTAAFRMELDDVTVEMVEGRGAADVLLTASFVRRSLSTGEESRDAREFAVVCQKSGGTWRIARVTAVDTLR